MSIAGKSIETEGRLMVARAGEGAVMNDCLTGTVSPLRVIKMPWNYTEVMVAQHCKYTKWH